MPRFLITETVEYLVTTNSRDEAEAVFLERGPVSDCEPPVTFCGVVERIVEPADE